MKARQYVQAPRIEIVLLPEGDPNKPSTLFDIGLILHVPDGKRPEAVRVHGGPFDRGAAWEKLATMWMEIGEQYADPTQGGNPENILQGAVP
jgi:hypothetical protein